MRLVLFGLFIKMAVADNLAVYVEKAYAGPVNYSSLDLITGIFFYSFQIYGDFHGYSTIAIGTALCLGIRLTDNFNTPYLAASATEFWRRWHISLYTWFRDYLYIALGGKRSGSTFRWAAVILAVFLASGLWHGANWTFVFWGGLWGVVYSVENGMRALSGQKGGW